MMHSAQTKLSSHTSQRPSCCQCSRPPGPTAGVGVVKVAGTHLIGDGALCGFGSSDPVDAEVVSSALVKCEAPSHAPGLMSLELSTAGEGQTFSQSGMVWRVRGRGDGCCAEPPRGSAGWRHSRPAGPQHDRRRCGEELPLWIHPAR